MSVNRRPAGTAAGGQFTANAHAESDVLLDDPLPDFAVGAPTVTDPDGLYPVVTGAKYTRWRDVTDIARDVRADIKAAVAAGHLPAHLAYSVRCQRYAGGQAVHIDVRGVPDADHFALSPAGYEVDSAQVRNLTGRLEAIAGQYNRESTNSQIDYFHAAFHLCVNVRTESYLLWDEGEKDRARHRRELAAVRDLDPGQADRLRAEYVARHTVREEYRRTLEHARETRHDRQRRQAGFA